MDDVFQQLMQPQQPPQQTTAQNIGGMLQGLGAGFQGQPDPRIAQIQAQQDMVLRQKYQLMHLQDRVERQRAQKQKVQTDIADSMVAAEDPMAKKLGWEWKAKILKEQGFEIPQPVLDSLSQGKVTKIDLDRGASLASAGASDKEIQLALPGASPEHIALYRKMGSSPEYTRKFTGKTAEEMAMDTEMHQAKLRSLRVAEIRVEADHAYKMSQAQNAIERLAEQKRHNRAIESLGVERLGKTLSSKEDKRKETFAVIRDALNQMDEVSTNINTKHYLPKGSGGVLSLDPSAIRADANRRMFPNDPDWVRWKQLQSVIIGFDRSVMNDIGARAFAAFKNQFNFFDNPPTKEAIDKTITQMRRLLDKAEKNPAGMEKLVIKTGNGKFMEGYWKPGEPLPDGQIVNSPEDN